MLPSWLASALHPPSTAAGWLPQSMRIMPSYPHTLMAPVCRQMAPESGANERGRHNKQLHPPPPPLPPPPPPLKEMQRCCMLLRPDPIRSNCHRSVPKIQFCQSGADGHNPRIIRLIQTVSWIIRTIRTDRHNPWMIR